MMPASTRMDEARKIVRESYLATLGVGQIVLDKSRELSSAAARYAQGGRESLDGTVRDLIQRGERVLRTAAFVGVREAIGGSYGSRPTARPKTVTAKPSRSASSAPAKGSRRPARPATRSTSRPRVSRTSAKKAS